MFGMDMRNRSRTSMASLVLASISAIFWPKVGDFRQNGLCGLVIAGFLSSADASGSLVFRSAQLVGFVEQIAPCLVEFNHLLDVVVGQTAFGVVGTNHIGVFSKHGHVKH